VPSNVCFGGNSGHRNPGTPGPLVTPRRTSSLIGFRDPEVLTANSMAIQAQKALQPYQVGRSPPGSRVYTAQPAYFSEHFRCVTFIGSF
jgi:hypothetical protein